MFIKLLYYFRVVFITVANLHILKLCEQIPFYVKECIIIFFFNNLSQLFESYSVEFFFAIKCTGNHRLQRMNKAGSDDLFDVFIVTVFK